MKIDLHIHTKTCSDGGLSIEEIFKEAKKRNIDLMSITDHDSIDCQERAIALAKEYGINYITGVLLSSDNVTLIVQRICHPIPYLFGRPTGARDGRELV